jgi:hypothetical protein
MAEAYRLGVRWSAGAVPPPERPWRYLPDRGDEVTGERTSITISLALAELLKRCAEHVGTSEPLFIIGATLAYIGQLKACLKAIHADTPEEASAIRAGLGHIKLPAHYEYPPPSKRKRRAEVAP